VDVRAADAALLRRVLGGHAEHIRRLSYGDDPRPVEPNRPAKSSSCENTYAQDLVDGALVRREIEAMARRVADWLRRRSLAARTVTIKVRYADFTTVTRSRTAARATGDAGQIVACALALLARTETGRRPVRLLGVGVHGLLADDPGLAGPEPLPFGS
ncbi:MAG: DNA polymerase IV, partial [Betaproteobacteria bacterium]|nr:DNA polymerase IV [Betaproteobacteria bacterium]